MKIVRSSVANGFAYQIHARLGEVLVISTMISSQTNESRTLSEAIRRFCRSIELCDDYLRGYYGMKMVRFLPRKSSTTKLQSDVRSIIVHLR